MNQYRRGNYTLYDYTPTFLNIIFFYEVMDVDKERDRRLKTWEKTGDNEK